VKILVHDFGGYSFPIQLSRELARRGHAVTHAYPIGLPGPKGRLVPSVTDPVTLKIAEIPLPGIFRKYSASRRLIAQQGYARDLANFIRTDRPDVVISGNTPIDVQALLLRSCKADNIGFIHWIQDVYCEALEYYLRKRCGPLAKPLAYPWRRIEKWVANNSSCCVAISPAFKALLQTWAVAPSQIIVQENWAPIDEIELRPRQNDWSRRHGINNNSVVFMYAGTLGFKHNPILLHRVAEHLGNTATVVVISEGVGRQFLEQLPKLPNLRLMDFQPYSDLPNVLGTADVLVASLETNASSFAVPSKTLSYLCAGRPQLLAGPQDNSAATIIRNSKSGLVVDPQNVQEWLSAANTLATDSVLRERLGQNGRRYAETVFNITTIAETFEQILERCTRRKQLVAPEYCLVGH
jgi:colanic acid biosynthesis glycosyl transferase WcaI